MRQKMSDDELGKHFYNYVNRGWPNQTWTWESLPDVSKKFYIERAKKAKERYKNENVR
jgi:hypothetical protein